MNSKGRIGIIIPHINSNIDTEFIDIIHRKCTEYGYDTIVITGVINYKDEMLEWSYTRGQTNIYDIILHGDFDGFIFEANIFCSEIQRKRILDLLRKKAVPCLVVNYEQTYFPVISADEEYQLYCSAEHLINVHGCRKLYCIGGYKGHIPSENRIRGFCRAMDKAGLAYDENSIFYGCYWRDIPHRIAVDIAEGVIEKPDGIVCGSDIMAVEVIDTLTEYGVRVPEDIAVTGCDGNSISQNQRISVTTMAGQERQNGYIAINTLLNMLGENTKNDDMLPELVIGESCGCADIGGICRNRSLSDIREYTKSVFSVLEKRKTNSHGEMIRKMTECKSMKNVIESFAGCCYMIPTGLKAELCLCEDWCRNLDNPIIYRRGGLTDNMFRAVEAPNDACEKMLSFRTKELFPTLQLPHEPKLIVMTSIHYKGQIFGYVGFTYKKAVHIVLDEFFTNWCDAVGSGLNAVQNRMYKDYVNKRIESISEFAPVLGIYNKRGLINKMMTMIAEIDSPEIKLNMLTYIKEERVHYGVPPINSIVNALRISESESVMASLNDDIIAIAEVDDNINLTENDIAQMIADKVKSSYKGAIEIKHERIAVVSCTVLKSDIFRIESMISDAEDNLKGRIINQSLGVISYKERFNSLRSDIMNHPEKDWNIEAIIRSMGYSKSHFHRLYKELYNTSCKEDIIASRLEKVKWYLKNTSLSISQISEICGYSNYSHFIRQFTDRMGVSPTVYRKEKK